MNKKKHKHTHTHTYAHTHTHTHTHIHTHAHTHTHPRKTYMQTKEGFMHYISNLERSLRTYCRLPRGSGERPDQKEDVKI